MKKNNAFTLVEVFIIVIIIGLLVVMFSGPLFGVDKEGATRVLRAQGYSEVQITGYRWFTGDKNDFYHTGFSAKSPNGTAVTGTVTKGFWWKANTVRLD